MRKIYLLLPDLSAGGAERVTITIARLLKKNGFDKPQDVFWAFCSSGKLTIIRKEAN